MSYAGYQALRSHYGHGHYKSVQTHGERWRQFSDWARDQGIRDAQRITQETLESYARYIGDRVAAGELSVAYAQNLLSTVNVTLEALRGDRALRVSPATYVGARSTVRETAPTGYSRAQLGQALSAMRSAGLERAAAVAELGRELGLRSREASLLDAKSAYREATIRGSISVVAGTKGGRPREVPITQERQVQALARAAEVQGQRANVMDGQSYRNWTHGELRAGRELLRQYGIAGYHDLRAAYAVERYEALTGRIAPVLGGTIGDREIDRQARSEIARELGHGRIDVVSEYIGGRG